MSPQTRRRTGYSSNPPSSGGGGGGGPTYLLTTHSGYTEIQTSGKISDGTGGELEFIVDSGQIAAVTSEGLSGLIGAGVWDYGPATDNAVSLEITLGTVVNASRFCICMGIGTVPTTMAEIRAGQAYFGEFYINSSGGINTRCKIGTFNLMGSNFDNHDTSTKLQLQVAADTVGYGPGHIMHIGVKGGTKRRDEHTNSTQYTHTSGDLWFAVCYGKAGTAGAEETLKLTVEVR